MRLPFVRLSSLTILFLAIISMTAAAGTLTSVDLTPTGPPTRPADDVVTPTPSPAQPAPPTAVRPGQIYEGNYFGIPVEFLLNAELGQFFVLDVTTEDFDAVLEIYDESGTQVARDDDSGAGNMPQIIFAAPSTGTFTLTLRGFSDPVEGSYILHVSTAVESLTFGEPVQASFDGAASMIYTFEAQAGDVIDIIADSRDMIDTTLRLVGPGNAQIGYVDDFTGIDPEFRRLPLSAGGTYYLIHAPYSTSAVGEVTLRITKTELMSLSADPTFYVIEQGKDIFNLGAEAGELYLVTLTSDREISGSLEIADMAGIGTGSVTFSLVEGASLLFRSAESGTYRLTVTVSNSAGEPQTGVFLSIRPTGQ